MLNFFRSYHIGIALVVPSLDFQICDPNIEFQFGRVNGNFPRDPDPIVD